MVAASTAVAAWTWRREIAIVGGAVCCIVLLPIFAVIGVMTNGVQGVSDSLVNVNETTHQIEVRTLTGKIITTLEASTTWPVKGVVTQEFGNPNPPYQLTHSGIDIDGGFGAPVTAFMAGRVISVGNYLAGCGSHCVTIDHGYGITSIYAHMSGHRVQVNQSVKPGDIIGFEGEEGWAHGAHLHFEIRVLSVPVNPRSFMIGNPEKK